MKMKCAWCNKEIEKENSIKVDIDFNELYMCCEECKENYSSYYKYAMKNQGKFIILTLIACIVIVPFAILAGAYNNGSLVGVGFGIEAIFLGAVMIKYPFATGYSTRKMGAEKAQKSVKKVGKIFFILGVILLIIIGILSFL